MSRAFRTTGRLFPFASRPATLTATRPYAQKRAAEIQPRNYKRADGTYEPCDELRFMFIIGYQEELKAVSSFDQGLQNVLLLSRYNSSLKK